MSPPGTEIDDEAYRERLARVTIGPPTRAPGGRIELQDPDPTWQIIAALSRTAGA